MPDSLGFPAGRAAQVIRLSRLKFLVHLAFEVRQKGLPSTGQPMVRKATKIKMKES